MLKSAAYVAGWANALTKLGAMGVPSLRAIKSEMAANAARVAKPAVENVPGTMAHALKYTPTAGPLRGPAQAKIDARLNPNAPAQRAMPVENPVSSDLLQMPQAQLPPAAPDVSPYGVRPAPKRQAAPQPEIPATRKAPASSTASAPQQPAESAGGPFAKLRNANLGPKAAIGLGLGAGGLYAANQLGQDPQMTVTPSAPYYMP